MLRYLLAGTAIVVGTAALVLGSYDDPVEAARSAWNTVIAPAPTEAQRQAEQQAQLARHEAEQARQRLVELEATLAETKRNQAQSADLARQTTNVGSTDARPVPPKPQVTDPKPVPRPQAGPTLSDREALLTRLRKRFVNADDLPSPGPRQRLLDARTAVMQGRVIDAEKYLQEAHTQIAFQPVTPDQASPRVPVSMASQRIAKALADLNGGNPQRALQNIDLAAQSID